MSNITVGSVDLASVGIIFVQYQTVTGQNLAELVPEIELELRETENGEMYVLTEEYQKLLVDILNSEETRNLMEARMEHLRSQGLLPDDEEYGDEEEEEPQIH